MKPKIVFSYFLVITCVLACSNPMPSSLDSDAATSIFNPEAFDMALDAGEMVVGEMIAGEMNTGIVSEAGLEMNSGTEMIAGSEPNAGSEMEAGIEMMAGFVAGDEILEEEDPLAGLGMCDQWNTIWSLSPNVTWSGSTQSCEAGAVNAEALETVLRLTNFYRELAELSPVSLSTTNNEALQACALLMHANGRLSHQPPESWACYESDGAYMASQSNLAGSNAIDAVAMYMIDPGNETTMGHRRWIMSPGLETIGVGSTNEYSCMSVLHLNRPRAWVAFPPPGEFPIQATQDRWRRSIDQTGWTIQYDGINLSNAQVSITAYALDDPNDAGEQLPVELVSLRPNYGSASAYNIIPQGWQSEVGKRYTVRLSNDSENIEYSVEFVDCR